ncbi:MAG: hypothetical protein IT349_10760 [Candidatus Eisenbacteria bacterium]|nr:hypothetical protein [Candidatus Eisenbacteria bacterium]
MSARTHHPNIIVSLLRGGTLALVLGSFALGGCADRRDVIETKAHPPEWRDTESADFHGLRIGEDGARACVGCHGDHLEGRGNAPGCDDCHAGAGGHPFGWDTPSSAEFHGAAVAAEGPDACIACHGEDHRGGWSDVSCYACHAGGPSGHPDGWLETRSLSFHGLVVMENGVDDCTRCHGFGLSGGTSHVACADCH